MRTTAKRALATLTVSAALAMITIAGASAATASDATGAAAATRAPAGAPRWEFIGEFPKAQCIDLRDSYAGKAKCVKNAGGQYDLLIWV
ncbi:hypothetical protein [Streptomyces lavendulae]|uniref:hypothetical protein n=1 Tax=Streptomyces lavendulae TaxID=1914 RepID=UPI0024A10E1A|nr:hypothetical protein Sros01_83610 [Streptomyces roseochromogenus]